MEVLEVELTPEDDRNRMMAVVDPAFRIIPRNSTFFLIWRIENLQVVPISKDNFGSFYTGDSYVVACASEPGDKADCNQKNKQVQGSLEIHIHFWLGAETSQDEAAVAAYKTVELDDYLGGSPVQHREVQGWESKRFLSYFRKGMRLLEGGVASGLTHVDTSVEPCMYHIKGKRRPLVRQVKSISWENMNDGDVFIIDAGQVIFVWSGRHANNMEKIQGALVSQQLKGEHGGGNIVLVEDASEKLLPRAERDIFNELLPLNAKNLKSYKDVVADDVLERRQKSDLKLYRCSDEDGTLKVTEVKNGPLDQKDLIFQDSFIIDNGEAGIWVWVGKRASNKERTEAMRNAQGFIKKKGYPQFTQVTRVIDGGEPIEFKTLFRSWKNPQQTVGLGKTNNIGRIAKTVQTKFDASTLHENTRLAAQTQMVDGGTGSKEVFRVEKFELIPLASSEYGTFYSGDCYVIVYAYNSGNRDHFIIYYWLGAKSSVDEQGTAALKTIELDDKLDGRAVQVRVVQGKEPPHFMAIFGGKMIVFEGGVASGFSNGNGYTNGHGDMYMLHVRGTSEYNTKAVQVDLRAASLNSNDVFVLISKSATYIWAGRGSTGDEREMAKRIASQSSKDVILVSEGQERQDFWDAIGGREPYASNKQLQVESDNHNARLFQCSNASGQFIAEEVVDFSQTDLVEDDIMLLDAWFCLFIWVGKHSNAEERKLAVDLAEEYLYTDPSGRDISTPILVVKQGFEPPNFTGFFGAWDRSLWNSKKTYEEIKAELVEDNPGIIVVQPQANGQNSTQYLDKYPLEMLRVKNPELLPEGVDPSCKEVHLNDEDFLQVFGMTYLEFQDLPKWKQLDTKKRVGLF